MSSKILSVLLCCLPLISCDSKVEKTEQNTINPKVQQIVQKELKSAVAEYQAKGATSIIMNSKTGEIVSMASVGKANPMRYVYEMGSVFKIFNTALAYENGLDNKKYKIDEPLIIYDKYGKQLLAGPIDDVPSFKRYMRSQGITKVTASDIMLYSSTVGSAKIALDLPDNAQQDFFHKLHLDEKLELDFGKTEKGLMHANWGPVERATASFGHGIAVTPIHLLAAVNAITNGGTYIYPTMVRNNTQLKFEKLVVSSDTSAKIRNLRASVPDKRE